MSNAEQTLLDRCLEGERAAQKMLYDKYSGAMYTTAVRILNDPELANDVLQDTFIDVFRDLNSFKGKSTLGAWIKTILMRHAFRKKKFESRYEEFEETEDDRTVEMMDQFTGAYLETIISELPDGYRAVFLLVEVEGYSHKEVAQMMNISVGTSRSQLHHAKIQLRKKLKGEYR